MEIGDMKNSVKILPITICATEENRRYEDNYERKNTICFEAGGTGLPMGRHKAK